MITAIQRGVSEVCARQICNTQYDSFVTFSIFPGRGEDVSARAPLWCASIDYFDHGDDF